MVTFCAGRRARIAIAIAILAIPSCLGAAISACSGGNSWVNEIPEDREGADVVPITNDPRSPANANVPGFPPLPELPPCDGGADCDPPTVMSAQGGAPRAVLPTELPADLFRNTYYDFPTEGAGTKDATVFDASCKAIAQVTKDFHDRVCVQGSGKLSSGQTVSFAKRGCTCAAMCPRTGQQICFEALDPKQFPNGRGALGKPITPLRTLAVDSKVIPLGTRVFIADFVGMPRPDGTKHDGCFIAEDRGTRVVGKQVDVFTGDPSVTTAWNKILPSNKGVRVSLNDARCATTP